MENDPAIHVGSIVSVRVFMPDQPTNIGKVTKTNIWDGIGGVEVILPDGGVLSISLYKCHNATEAERKEYFLAVLKHG